MRLVFSISLSVMPPRASRQASLAALSQLENTCTATCRKPIFDSRTRLEMRNSMTPSWDKNMCYPSQPVQLILIICTMTKIHLKGRSGANCSLVIQRVTTEISPTQPQDFNIICVYASIVWIFVIIVNPWLVVHAIRGIFFINSCFVCFLYARGLTAVMHNYEWKAL